MNFFPIASHHSLTRILLLFIFIFCSRNLSAQKHDADSLQKLLMDPMIHDTARVKNIRYLCNAIYKYNPDSALTIAYDGLRFAKGIGFKAGISNMYEIIAIILTRTGNYSSALSYYIENLKIEESLKSPDGMICANNNIGIIYVYMLDYEKALSSYLKAYEQLRNFRTDDPVYDEGLRYSTNLNIGDAYDRMKKTDSAFLYYNNSLNIAIAQKNNYNKGMSMLGIANVYAAMDKEELSLANYRTSLQYLTEANDEEMLCDACLGMAKVYKKLNQADSSLFYARHGLFFAKKSGFMSKQLDISNFLKEYFSETNRIDSAYYYLSQSSILKDSLLGLEKTKITRQIIFNESLRQLERIEKERIEKEERRQQLQHVFIVLLIPSLFLLTVLLARIRIRVKLIKFLGIISLLFLFEYLTLLLHPVVQKITHHTPLLEILIFVAIAGLIIPTHHRIEHWLIELLVKRVQNNKEKPVTATAQENEKETASVSAHTKKKTHLHKHSTKK